MVGACYGVLGAGGALVEEFPVSDAVLRLDGFPLPFSAVAAGATGTIGSLSRITLCRISEGARFGAGSSAS